MLRIVSRTWANTFVSAITLQLKLNTLLTVQRYSVTV
jgi:hypothetical protein